MYPRTLAIPLAFFLLAVVLCLILIGTKWNWWQKLLVIVVVPAFCIVIWSSLGSYKGWPTDSSPPRKAMVFWVMVREPRPDGSDPGAIYLWLRSLDSGGDPRANPLGYTSRDGEPRAYVLPYSRNMHKGADRARLMLKNGRPVVVEFGRKGGGGDGEGGDGDGDGDGQGGDGQGNGRGGYGIEPGREDVQFYELPPAVPPMKSPE